jgi:hypothetical protein
VFKKGNAFNEQDRGGWIYGAFMPEGFQKDDRAEIKITSFKKGFSNGYHYQKNSYKDRLNLEWKCNLGN